jgi:hypothetical protein
MSSIVNRLSWASFRDEEVSGTDSSTRHERPRRDVGGRFTSSSIQEPKMATVVLCTKPRALIRWEGRGTFDCCLDA